MTIIIRRFVPKGIMWAAFVVFAPPAMRAFTHFIKITEQVQAQELPVVSPVESFNISVLIRLARLYVLDSHPGLLGPGYKVSA